MSQEISLRNILNKNIEDHKAEIKFIAKSSLSNSKSPNILNNSVKWNTSRIPSTKYNLKSENTNLINKQFKSYDIDDFSNRMLLFSLGPDEIIDKTETERSIKQPLVLKSLNTKSKLKPLHSHSSLLPNRKQQREEVTDDLTRPVDKYVFSSPRYPCRLTEEKSPNTSCQNGNQSAELVPHYIHPRYKTRYQELIRFRNENIREKDETEMEIIKGTNLIRHLKKRLRTKLERIASLANTPNFHRLQIYTEIFDDLISESWMFGPLLSQIKSVYDAEVDRVLEMPVSQKELIESEIEQLRQSIYNKEKLEILQSEIHQIEDALKIALEAEKESNILLKEEEKKMENLIEKKSKIDEEKKKLFEPKSITVLPTESEKLEILKAQCWDIMDKISNVQRETKHNMTSRATITHLTESLQDISIEVEKVNYHKNQLVSELDEMKAQLGGLLDDADITEKDYKLIYSILNGSSILPGRDYEESNKWSWYIS